MPQFVLPLRRKINTNPKRCLSRIILEKTSGREEWNIRLCWCYICSTDRLQTLSQKGLVRKVRKDIWPNGNNERNQKEK